jgi:hypothetical protein
MVISPGKESDQIGCRPHYLTQRSWGESVPKMAVNNKEAKIDKFVDKGQQIIATTNG